MKSKTKNTTRPVLLGLTILLAFSITSFRTSSTPFLKETGNERWPIFKEYRMNCDGYERSYWLYRPSKRKVRSSVPIVFVLHGGGGLAQSMPAFTKSRFNRLADRDGFLVVYPQGYESHWNDGRTMPDYVNDRAWKEDIDDVGFLLKIIDVLKEHYDIDDEKIFTCGNSNGGFMSNRLICDRPDVFRGAGIITATMDPDFLPDCKPSKPVGVMIFNGTKDGAIPYEGGDISVFGAKRGKILSTEDYANFWVKHNHCKTQEPLINIPDQDGDGTSASKVEYTDCDDESRVILYTIYEGGHTWPGAKSPFYELIAGKTCLEINACDLLWEFFKTL